jgi:hypothetical protein
METIEMRHDIPSWAKRKVTPEKPGFSEVCRLHRQGRAHHVLEDGYDSWIGDDDS